MMARVLLLVLTGLLLALPALTLFADLAGLAGGALIAIGALELGTPLSSLWVKIPVLIGGILLVVTTGGLFLAAFGLTIGPWSAALTPREPLQTVRLEPARSAEPPTSSGSNGP